MTALRLGLIASSLSLLGACAPPAWTFVARGPADATDESVDAGTDVPIAPDVVVADERDAPMVDVQPDVVDAGCPTGFESTPRGCDPIVPQLIAPLSTSTVSGRRPTLHWKLPPGVDGAVVERCITRACLTPAMVQVTGSSLTMTADLNPGMWFWRVRGRVGTTAGTRVSPTWQFRVGAGHATTDTSWGSDLDLNGDGLADVAVGASGGSAARGLVNVYYGARFGPSPMASVVLLSPDGTGSMFGSQGASAGDLDGDGFGDLAIASPQVGGGMGRVYIYYGGASGVETNARGMFTDATASNRTVYPAALGDVNGDGYGDLGVGSPLSSAARIYFGSPSGVQMAGAQILGTRAGEFGHIIGLGDYDSDGFADVAIGESSGAGRVYVYRGSATGLVEPAAVVINGPDGANARFGAVLAGGGDLNGDGLPDFLVRDLFTVREFLAMGTGTAATYATVSNRTMMSASLGAMAIGDVNGDGFADALIGEILGNAGNGIVFMHLGSNSGVMDPASVTLSDPAATGFSSDELGSAVAIHGDVNGDDVSDYSLGAPNTNNGTGAAYFYRGESGIPTGMMHTTLIAGTQASSFGAWVSNGAL